MEVAPAILAEAESLSYGSSMTQYEFGLPAFELKKNDNTLLLSKKMVPRVRQDLVLCCLLRVYDLAILRGQTLGRTSLWQPTGATYNCRMHLVIYFPLLWSYLPNTTRSRHQKGSKEMPTVLYYYVVATTTSYCRVATTAATTAATTTTTVLQLLLASTPE